VKLSASLVRTIVLKSTQEVTASINKEYELFCRNDPKWEQSPTAKRGNESSPAILQLIITK
jgi:hypothetical protein